MRGRLLAAAPLALLLATSCAEERANIVADDLCTQGVRWAGQEGDQRGLPDPQLRAMEQHQGAPEMHPGRDCIACHAALARGPKLLVAGTVFTRLRETSDCAGVFGAAVTIKDAAGAELELESNPMGNFFLRASAAPGFKPPFTAKLLYAGKERQMFTPQTNGSCNGCHTAQGTAPAGQGKAPGRICVDPNDPACTP